MRVDGIEVGVLYFVSRKYCNADRFLLMSVSETIIFTALQSCPPLPYDSVRSKVRLSHEPMMKGAEVIILGFIGTASLRIITVAEVALCNYSWLDSVRLCWYNS